MNMQKKERQTKSLLIVVGLAFLFPLGIFLVFKYRRHWLKKPWFIITASLCAILFIYAFANTITEAKNRQAAIATEEGRAYRISYHGQESEENPIEFDCNLQQNSTSNSDDKYPGESESLKCEVRTITGEFSKYDTVELIDDGDGSSLKIDGDTFSMNFNLKKYEKSDWEKDEIDFG